MCVDFRKLPEHRQIGTQFDKVHRRLLLIRGSELKTLVLHRHLIMVRFTGLRTLEVFCRKDMMIRIEKRYLNLHLSVFY